MKVVVKIGGAALEDRGVVRKFAQAIAEFTRAGHQVAVVHGGGVTLSRTMQQLGHESMFVNGLRVTDAETRDVALMVLAGKVNKQLAAAISAVGQPALGICGGDLRIMQAAKLRTKDDLGYVGEVCAVESKWFTMLWSNGVVPVLSSLAIGATDGEYYNINADSLAQSCASAFRADALIFLTEVPGVYGEDGSTLRWLSTEKIDELVKASVISGGMLPKLDACRRALRNGVYRVHIMAAQQTELLPGFFTQKMQCGTEVVRA
jgi:acetylglutamate kinase